MKTNGYGNRGLRGLRLALAAWAMMMPAVSTWGAGDVSTTASASGTVATAFGLEVNGNVTMGVIPIDNTYTESQTNTVSLKNNEDTPWYGKIKVNSLVNGATLEVQGGQLSSFTPITTANLTFTGDTSAPFINVPNGADVTLSYRAKSDGTLAGKTVISWTIAYTLSQGV